MADNTVFTEGLSFFLPRPNAPEYIKGSIVIEPKRFVEWMKANGQHLSAGRDRDGNSVQVFRVDLKVGQSGKAYAALNTWKPEKQGEGDDLAAY